MASLADQGISSESFYFAVNNLVVGMAPLVSKGRALYQVFLDLAALSLVELLLRWRGFWGALWLLDVLAGEVVEGSMGGACRRGRICAAVG